MGEKYIFIIFYIYIVDTDLFVCTVGEVDDQYSHVVQGASVHGLYGEVTGPVKPDQIFG